MKKLFDKQCPDCGSIRLFRRKVGMNQQASKNVWCNSCGKCHKYKDLDDYTGTRNGEGNVRTDTLAGTLHDMDPSDL